MKRLGPSTLRGRLFLLALLIIVAIAVAVSWPAPRPAPFLVLSRPFQIPLSLRDRFDRWIPAKKSWGWAWRLEVAVLGKRARLSLNADIVPIDESSDVTPVLGAPSFSDTNGLQVWLLDEDRLKTLREQLANSPGRLPSFRGRISTADGIESALFQGRSMVLGGTTHQVGLTFGGSARVHPGSTDLITWVTLSELVTNEPLGGWASYESIQTNLDVAARLQVPRGSGFLLLDRQPSDPGAKRFGILFEPLLPK